MSSIPEGIAKYTNDETKYDGGRSRMGAKDVSILEGQINKVCFVEGLVPFRGRWLLYYGTADSRIAVAVY